MQFIKEPTGLLPMLPISESFGESLKKKMLILRKWLSPVCRLLDGVTRRHRFPFTYEKIERLGEVFLPLVEVKIWFPKRKIWLEFQFIVDTGATATILPSFIAEELGLNLKNLPQVQMRGVEGTGVRSWLGEVKMRIGNQQFLARCFFINSPQTPFLLGRADVMDKLFSLLLDSKENQIVFIKN